MSEVNPHEHCKPGCTENLRCTCGHCIQADGHLKNANICAGFQECGCNGLIIATKARTA